MLFSLILACTASKEETEDPAEHACEHVGTSEETLTAGAAPGEGDVLAIDGEPRMVTLVDGAAGYVSVVVEGDTAALLFAGTADIVNGLYNEGTEETLPEGAPNEFCATDIPEHFDLDFHTAGTWSIEVGPAAVSEVWLLLISAEGHAHEE